MAVQTTPQVVEGADTSVDFVNSGRNVKISFTLDRALFAQVLDRWTWNNALITIRSGDRAVDISFPKIEERVSR